MDIAQAIRILDPSTTLEALAEVEYYAGFNGRAARIQAVDEACVVACEVMRQHLQAGRQGNA